MVDIKKLNVIGNSVEKNDEKAKRKKIKRKMRSQNGGKWKVTEGKSKN